MDKKDETLKLALDMLNELIPEVHDWYGAKVHRANAAITAIKEALTEQPAQQQEPTFTFGEVERTMQALRKGTLEQQQAYEVMKDKPLYTFQQPAQQKEPVGEVSGYYERGFTDHKTLYGKLHNQDLPVGAKLYTSPPASKPWVGLTDEEISQLWIGTSPYFNEDDFARAIEAKLREKNA